MTLDPSSLTSRTSHTELPKGDEIMHISDAEEKRALLPEKQAIHFPNFETIKRIYDYYGLDTEIFDKSDLPAQYILDRGGHQIESLVKMILGKEISNEEVKLFKDAYAYLAEEDAPEPSDYIFVFGAKTPLRIEKAIELYKTGFAPKIIVSGRGPFYGEGNASTEAEHYAELALKVGIPQEAVIIEKESITIPDNVRRTLNRMDAQEMSYKSFIIVNSPYAQRRGWCVWKKHTSENVAIHRVNSATGERFASHLWYKNEDGLRVVLGEFIKLRNTIAFNDA
ncbi:YdcF family protein [Patescibacteria group bacterium]|nr:YdcF family protein [Patescibacteria group bacterium]